MTPDPDSHDLGVVFVHGIGEQRPGDLLTEAGDAMVAWLSRHGLDVATHETVLVTDYPIADAPMPR